VALTEEYTQHRLRALENNVLNVFGAKGEKLQVVEENCRMRNSVIRNLEHISIGPVARGRMGDVKNLSANFSEEGDWKRPF
jgi:hypothetical protein